MQWVCGPWRSFRNLYRSSSGGGSSTSMGGACGASCGSRSSRWSTDSGCSQSSLKSLGGMLEGWGGVPCGHGKMAVAVGVTQPVGTQHPADGGVIADGAMDAELFYDCVESV
jgi:hypothetical protein